MVNFIQYLALFLILISPQEQKEQKKKIDADTIRKWVKIESRIDSIHIQKQQDQIMKLDSIINLKKKK